MQKYEVTYDVGFNETASYVVQAENITEARKKALRRARKDFYDPMYPKSRILKPVDLLDHERQIKARDTKIKRLYAEINKIKAIVDVLKDTT